LGSGDWRYLGAQNTGRTACGWEKGEEGKLHRGKGGKNRELTQENGLRRKKRENRGHILLVFKVACWPKWAGRKFLYPPKAEGKQLGKRKGSRGDFFSGEKEKTMRSKGTGGANFQQARIKGG